MHIGRGLILLALTCRDGLCSAGGPGWERAWCGAGGSAVQATSAAVSRDRAAGVLSFLHGGAQPCPWTEGPRAQVFSCASPAGSEPRGAGVPWLLLVVGNAAGLWEGGQGAPGVTGSRTVPPLRGFISPLAWMRLAPSHHEEAWQ